MLSWRFIGLGLIASELIAGSHRMFERSSLFVTEVTEQLEQQAISLQEQAYVHLG
jgi:hypothetical protein